MSGESNLWKYTYPRLKPYGRLLRIENSTENGTLDVYYIMRGYPGWMELKHAHEEPVRPTTPMYFRHFTIEQLNWIEDEAKSGGRASIFMQIGDRYIVIGPTHARPLYERKLTMKMLRDVALYQSVGEIRPAELMRCLTRPISTSPF